MKRLARLALVPVALVGLAACGSGGGEDSSETEALRAEVAALKKQLSASTTTTAPAETTPTLAPTTTTTAAPAPTPTTTPKATPTTKAPTTTTTPPTTTPPTTTPSTAPPTTVTTKKQPQGTVTWSQQPMGSFYQGGACRSATFRIVNRSDTPLLDVTIKGAYVYETYDQNEPYFQVKYRDGVALPDQKLAAGIAAFGEKDVTAQWCGPALSPGTTGWNPRVGTGSDLAWTWMR